jgi:hypothetical protein
MAIETLRALWQPGTREYRVRGCGCRIATLDRKLAIFRYARNHHAGTADDHIGRYRLLADRGVTTVFVSLPDLTGPQDLFRLAPVTAAFA